MVTGDGPQPADRGARGGPRSARARGKDRIPPPYLAAGGCLQRRPRRTATCSAPPCARGTARRKESYQQRGTSPSERGRRLPARRGACARPRHAARRSAGSGRCSVPRSSPAASDSGGEGPGHRSASRGRTAPPPQQRPQLHGWGGDPGGRGDRAGRADTVSSCPSAPRARSGVCPGEGIPGAHTRKERCPGGGVPGGVVILCPPPGPEPCPGEGGVPGGGGAWPAPPGAELRELPCCAPCTGGGPGANSLASPAATVLPPACRGPTRSSEWLLRCPRAGAAHPASCPCPAAELRVSPRHRPLPRCSRRYFLKEPRRRQECPGGGPGAVWWG